MLIRDRQRLRSARRPSAPRAPTRSTASVISRGAQAVGEDRHAVGGLARRGSRRRRRRRRRRSSPRSPADGRRGSVARRAAGADMCSGSRLDDRHRLAAADPQRLRLLLAERERLLGAVELEPQPVLAPGGDLADDGRAERALVGLELHDRGVLGADARAARRRRRRARTRRGSSARSRSGTAVSVRAHSRVMRWPETNSARSHQCEPMSANAREAPPRSASTRQLSSSGAAASPAGRCRGSAAAARSPRCGRARAPRARSGSSGKRTARRPGGRVAAAASTRRLAPGRVDRQRLLADDVLAGGQRGLGERQRAGG